MEAISLRFRVDGFQGSAVMVQRSGLRDKIFQV